MRFRISSARGVKDKSDVVKETIANLKQCETITNVVLGRSPLCNTFSLFLYCRDSAAINTPVLSFTFYDDKDVLSNRSMRPTLHFQIEEVINFLELENTMKYVLLRNGLIKQSR